VTWKILGRKWFYMWGKSAEVFRCSEVAVERHILYYFEDKTLFSHFFLLKIEVCLKFEELFTSLQTVHRVAWEEPNANTFIVSHKNLKIE
jgi:hypothetical protein